MSTARRLHHSYEDYLRMLEGSDLKLEYCDGDVYAMAGGTPAHAALGAAALRVLGQRLPAGCVAYSSDLKVRVEATGLATFPDATFVCGPLATAAGDPRAVANPTVLVEVTSRSTEDYDRGEKLSHYKQIPSLRAVVFVSHRERRVTVVARGEDGWTQREARPGEEVVLAQPALRVPVDELYAGLELEPA